MNRSANIMPLEMRSATCIVHYENGMAAGALALTTRQKLVNAP